MNLKRAIRACAAVLAVSDQDSLELRERVLTASTPDVCPLGDAMWLPVKGDLAPCRGRRPQGRGRAQADPVSGDALQEQSQAAWTARWSVLLSGRLGTIDLRPRSAQAERWLRAY